MSIDTSALGVTWSKEKGTVTPIAPAAPVPVANTPPSDRASQAIADDVLAALRTVRDPEIPLNIYDLGLIYGVVTEPAGYVGITMTLTSPMCPAAGTLPAEVRSKLGTIAGVTRVDVDITWDPPWDRSRMSDAARLQLNLE